MNDFGDERSYYRPEYWFDNPEHDDCSNFGPEYFGNALYSSLITQLQDIPSEGYIVVLGTNRCVSFEILCNHFGYARCIGYDLVNQSDHPCVRTRDCSTLSEADDIPIAFCHNDIGSYPTTPTLKAHCQRWAARNTLNGGYVLSRNNKSRVRFDVEGYMESLGFRNQCLSDLTGQYDLSILDDDCISSHMLSRREL